MDFIMNVCYFLIEDLWVIAELFFYNLEESPDSLWQRKR